MGVTVYQNMNAHGSHALETYCHLRIRELWAGVFVLQNLYESQNCGDRITHFLAKAEMFKGENMSSNGA